MTGFACHRLRGDKLHSRCRLVSGGSFISTLTISNNTPAAWQMRLTPTIAVLSFAGCKMWQRWA